MVQRSAARYVTNRYHNTSSVTSMLDHIEWESLEARQAKNQLTIIFKIIHGLVDRSLFPANITSLAFSLVPFVIGHLYHPMWLKLPVWYPSNKSSQVCQFRCLARPCKYMSMISLSMCCRGIWVPWYLQIDD